MEVPVDVFSEADGEGEGWRVRKEWRVSEGWGVKGWVKKIMCGNESGYLLCHKWTLGPFDDPHKVQVTVSNFIKWNNFSNAFQILGLRSQPRRNHRTVQKIVHRTHLLFLGTLTLRSQEKFSKDWWVHWKIEYVLFLRRVCIQSLSLCWPLYV